MGSQVLILTDDLNVERSLEEWLGEVEGTSPLFASEAEDGLVIAHTSSPSWVIVDADLIKAELPQYLEEIQVEAGSASIMLLYPQEGKADLPWLDLNVAVSLGKPLNRVEFLRAFKVFTPRQYQDAYFHDRPTVPRPPLQTAAPKPAYPWLKDPAQAEASLERHLMTSSVRVALLFHDGQLWASSGAPPRHAERNVVGELLRYCERMGILSKISNGDLVRYVRLGVPNSLVLLYATRLTDGMNLALVLNSKTNFRDVRNIARQFASGLLTPPGEMDGTESDPIVPLKEFRQDEPGIDLDAGEEYEQPLPKLSLGDVPIPTPASMRHTVPPRAERISSYEQDDWALPPLDPASQHGSSSVEVTLNDPFRVEPVSFEVARPPGGQIVRTSPGEIQIAEMPGLPEAYEVIQTGTGRDFIMRVLSPAIYTLQYACLLVPRLPNHQLSGDLATRLSYRMPRLMMAFGWRLERLAMQPGYLHWIVSVPPDASPESVLAQTRAHTSEHIFQEFPRLKADNPSGDFWAPGYLVMTGTQPLPEEIIKQYVQHTRHRQGLAGDWT